MPTELSPTQWQRVSAAAFIDAWNWYMTQRGAPELIISPGEERPTALDRHDGEGDKDYAKRTDPYRAVIREFQHWFQQTMDGWQHDIGAWKKAVRSDEESADDGAKIAEAQIDLFPTQA